MTIWKKYICIQYQPEYFTQLQMLNPTEIFPQVFRQNSCRKQQPTFSVYSKFSGSINEKCFLLK